MCESYLAGWRGFVVQSCGTSDALAACLFLTSPRIYISFAVPRVWRGCGLPTLSGDNNAIPAGL